VRNNGDGCKDGSGVLGHHEKVRKAREERGQSIMKEQALKRQSNQHTSWRLEASSPSCGVVVIQMETFHKYDGWKQMGGG